MVGKNTEHNIRQIVVQENQQLLRINQEQDAKLKAQSQKIYDLETQLAEFAFTLPEQQNEFADNIESSFARMKIDVTNHIKDEIEESLENLPAKTNNPFLPIALGASGIMGILIALGLNLNFNFGESSISYNGEGVTGGLVSIVIAATGGGVVTTSFKPVKEIISKLKQQ